MYYLLFNFSDKTIYKLSSGSSQSESGLASVCPYGICKLSTESECVNWSQLSFSELCNASSFFLLTTLADKIDSIEYDESLHGSIKLINGKALFV